MSASGRDKWIEVGLADFCDTISKRSGIKKSQYLHSGEFPIFDQAKSYVTAYTDDEAYVNNDYPITLFGDHTRVVKYINEPYTLGNDGIKLLKAKPGYDDKFVYYLIQSKIVPETGYNRHFKYLNDQYIVPVSVEKQRHIASVLEANDRVIVLTQNIIQHTQALKDGLLQKLLDDKGYDEVSIKDSGLEIIDGDRGSNYPKLIDLQSKGHCVFLSTPNINFGSFDFSDTKFISEERDNLLRKGKLQRNDIVLTTRGTVGRLAWFDERVPYDHLRINSGMVIIRSSGDWDAGFLLQQLLSPLVQNQMKNIASGSAQPQLPISSLNRLPLIKPLLKDQQKIAEYLEAVDRKLSVNLHLNAQYTALKKGLLHELLADKVTS